MTKGKMFEKRKKTSDNKKSKRFLIIFISSFLAIVLSFGLTLGIISAVRNSRAAIKYKGLTMDKEEASFFLSYYKYRYMSLLSRVGIEDVEDSPGFWNKINEDEGKSYGELLKSTSEDYIKQMIVANYLFDSYTSLSSDEKNIIDKAVKNILSYKAEGDKDIFNSLSKEYGFSYKTFKSCAKMLYKSGVVQNVIYGADGSNLSSFPDLCAEYLSEYSHVKLLFIRTSDTFVLDDNGDRVIGDDGNDKTRPLTDAEKEERRALISEIQGYIDGIGNSGIEMGATMFDYYLENNDEGDEDMHADGYYFHEDSAYTKEFSTAFKEIVDKALSMEIDTFDSVNVDFGVCFIYKYQPTVAAYASTLAEACFEDFYKNASDALFDDSLKELSVEAKLTDIYNELDIVTLPYNHILLPVF